MNPLRGAIKPSVRDRPFRDRSRAIKQLVYIVASSCVVDDNIESYGFRIQANDRTRVHYAPVRTPRKPVVIMLAAEQCMTEFVEDECFTVSRMPQRPTLRFGRNLNDGPRTF